MSRRCARTGRRVGGLVPLSLAVRLADRLVPAMPWWASAALIIVGLLGLVVLALARIALPQHSADRLAWWRAVFEERRERRRDINSHPPHGDRQ